MGTIRGTGAILNSIPLAILVFIAEILIRTVVSIAIVVLRCRSSRAIATAVIVRFASVSSPFVAIIATTVILVRLILHMVSVVGAVALIACVGTNESMI